MEWQTPSFVEIDMSAEIGAYQSDDFDTRAEQGSASESDPQA
ncbi:MAG: hypothetical protein ACHQ53_10345 [Polyangiales bacterium]|jgi:coenzyme PQQ precursor peptide PqqA